MTITLKDLIKMVCAANELNQLLGEKKKIIEIRLFDYESYKPVTNYREYRKFMKAQVYEEFQSQYENPMLTQEAGYNNYFEDGSITVHIY